MLSKNTAVKTFTKKSLSKIYNSGKSMPETAQLLGCAESKVRYWMEKYRIKRRSHSDAAYIKQNPDGDPFTLRAEKEMTRKEVFLFGLGVGIYWGEGNKSPACSSLRVSNTDPHLIKAFIKFLKTIYKLSDKRFSYSLICFNDVSPVKARLYWSRQLGISPDKFGKITIIPPQGKGTYRKKSQYGVCTVQGNNTKLRKIVLNKMYGVRSE